MPDMPVEYLNAMTKAMLAAKVLPSAIEDISARILRDRPGDIVGYVEACKASLPSYFEAPAPSVPVEPTPGAEGYNDWFLKNLERIAGTSKATPQAAAKAQAPRQISRSSETFDKDFVAHLDAIASGQCEVVP